MSTGGSSTRRTRRRVAWTVAGVVLALLLGAGVWVAWKGSVAYVGLRDAQDAAGKARAAIGRGDTPEATRQLEVMSSSLDRSREAAADPVWSAASSVPWVGPNLRAVTTLSAALGDLVDEGVAPVVDAASLVTSGGLAPRDGRIDLAPIAAAAPADARGRRRAHLPRAVPQLRRAARDGRARGCACRGHGRRRRPDDVRHSRGDRPAPARRTRARAHRRGARRAR